MAGKDELKQIRSKKKTALTRMESKLSRYIAEENDDEVGRCMDNLQEEFKQFEIVHDGYHKHMESDQDIEDSVNYIIEVEEKYAEALCAANKWIISVRGSKHERESVSEQTFNQSVLSPEVLNVINLPKLEMCVYDGDPLLYHPFITAFDENVDTVATTDGAKLNRLVSYTSGTAKTAIQSCLILGGSKGYQLARKTLKQRFGDDLVISQAIISSLRDGPSVRNASDLRKLADELVNSNVVLSRLSSVQEVESQRFIATVVNRLQSFQKGKWRKIAMEKKRKSDKYPDFDQLVTFIQGEADIASDPVYGDSGLLQFNRVKPGFNQQSSYNSPGRLASRGTMFVSSEGRTVTPCSFCSENHRLYMCQSFKSLKAEQKLGHIVEKRLCENCLLGNHTVDKCFRNSMCGIDGCSQKHSRFIHRCRVSSDLATSSQAGSQVFTTESGNQAISVFTQSSAQVCIPVVEVRVNNRLDSVAMLDTCSTTTFCTEKLAGELGLKGVPITYELNTLTSTSQLKKTRLIPSMYIESKSLGQSICLKNVYVIDNIPASESKVKIDSYEHLAGIDVKTSNTSVDILIGQDNAEALIPLEVRRGRIGEPFAVKTVLGWSLHGNTGSQSDMCGLVRTGRVSCRIVSNFIQSDSVKLDRLEDKVDELWRLDHEGLAGEVKAMSCEDVQVLKFWDESVEVVEGHYEMPIPWKQGVQVPDNEELARSRLRSLRRSLGRRGILDRYDSEIQKLLVKGYAEQVTDSEIQNSSSKIWYLPHHGVISDKKPGKLRVVFDCAAQFKGESLNDKCKQGPDLNNKLVHVLLRFRQHELAIMADVEAMYYQVKVSEEDRDALRFLWVDEEGREVVYRMNAHIFGGIWCACIATYAMRRTLEDQQVEDEFVRDVVRRSFYVDDCLRSVTSIEDAKKVTKEVKEVLKKGGFNLTKFVTNKEEILEEISMEDRAVEAREFDRKVVSKALGVSWDVKEDVFKVKVEVKEKEVTRRSMLSTIASMYDPLGLVVPCTITGRMLFQEATRMKLGWEEEVPTYIVTSWLQWLQSLEELNEVSFPRCMKPSDFEDARYEVHNFSDASQKGYGCCSYLRSISKSGQVHVSLIASKGRVCPMKHVTIPRLELQAALLSAQMNDVICSELDLPIAQSYFWVDSQIVLAYIQNKKKRLKVYVANRVSMIHSLSKAEQWKFVPGKQNTADHVSRGISPKELKKSRWEEGPSFLMKIEDDVASEKSYEISIDDDEVKNEVMVGVAIAEGKHPIDEIVDHYSSWYKAKKAIAWLMKWRARLLEKNKERRKEEITVKDLKCAEKMVIKHVQSQKYEQEVKRLKAGSVIHKSSSIRSLLPMMNEDEILCVGGRLRNMKNQDVCKHPCILPHDHPVTKLIVREYHEKAHQGTEWTLSLLRKKFWITRSRGVIKQVKQRCVICKKLYDRPKNQQMADLPGERLKVVNPFEYVGIDCFGPFYVKQGRAEVKRYGCIFTCLNIRAVHIEKLNSLETDSFINGFRRFITRRGTPVKVWSDNGTNFVGGSPEIMKCLQKLDEERIKKLGLQKEVEWNFNPPHASHMGGIWERQIRTIRKILSSLLVKHSDKLTDEVLETLFCEVEAMINSRPLTKLSEDVADMSTLSPNQLLLLNEEPGNFPGSFQKNDMYKQRWRFIQYLSNQFWKRWLKEYIPELQRRSKWYLKQENVKVGDVVLLQEENTPRFLWPLGLVVEVKEGRDKLVRTVKVKTQSTCLVRPVSKIVRLEC